MPSSRTYVQYGCGSSSPEGWLNFDVSPSLRLQNLPLVGPLFKHSNIVFSAIAKYGDIVSGLPVSDQSADGVYASHVLEHLSYQDFEKALRNTFRILKPGGIFRLVVPDLESRARRYLKKLEEGNSDASSWFMRTSYLGVEVRRQDPMSLIRRAFGNSAHLWMWDEKSMTSALAAAGFTNIRRCQFNDCEDKAFLLVEDPDRFQDGDIKECAMEARKPV